MIEYQILQALSQDEEYTRQVKPFLKQDYFQQLDHKLVYRVYETRKNPLDKSLTEVPKEYKLNMYFLSRNL